MTKQNILVVSLPKCGSSWVFRSLGQTFPEHARSMERIGYIPEADYAQGVIAKMVYEHAHGAVRHREFIKRFNKQIFLVRDPRDRWVSALLYASWNIISKQAHPLVESFPQLIEKKERDPASVTCQEIAKVLGAKTLWPKTTGSDLDLAPLLAAMYETEVPQIVVRYEDLLNGNGFAEISRFVGADVKPFTATRPDALLVRVGRGKRSGDWKKWLTPSDVEVLKPLVQPIIEKYGYDPDWTLDPNPVLDPKEGSLFVRQGIKQRLDEELRHQKKQAEDAAAAADKPADEQR